MMHALIAERHGSELARRVSDWFLHTDIRPAKGAQRASLVERYDVHHPRLVAALELMERHQGEPLRRSETARRVGLSTRQLDRLFSKKLKRSYQNHYRQIRLERARELLRHSVASVTDIAVALRIIQRKSFYAGLSRELCAGLIPSADRAGASGSRRKL